MLPGRIALASGYERRPCRWAVEACHVETEKHAETDLMFEVTPDERLALTVISVLIVAGAGARHVSNRLEASQWLEYSAESADTLDPVTNGVLRDAAEVELELERTRSEPLAPGEKIDPNSAPPEQLARLPRIGMALAQRIIESRTAEGPFRSMEDLRRVSGIGPALLEGITPHVDLPRGPPTQSRMRRRSEPLLDVNRATVEELQKLSGIGPALAERIVEYRDDHGRLRDAEQLEEVPGIGPSLRERLEPLVTFR